MANSYNSRIGSFFLSIIKSNKSVLALILTVLAAYFVSKTMLRNPIFILPILFLSFLSISIFTGKFRSKSTSLGTQMIFFFPLIFFYITGIPKIYFLPLAPFYFIACIYIFYGVLNLKNSFRVLNLPGGKIILLLIICLFYQYLMNLMSGAGFKLDLRLLEIIGIYFGIIFFVNNDIVRIIYATRVLALVLLFSIGWFDWEVLAVGPSSIRLQLYSSYLQKPYANINAMSIPNGLATYVFIFGYQLAVSVPLSIFLFVIEKKKSWKILWASGSIISLFAMMAAGERSVVFAVTCALFLFLYTKKKIKPAILIILLGISAIMLSSKTETSLKTFDRLRDKESNIEVIKRIELQLVAIKIIINNPLGLIASGKSWDDETRSEGADFSAWGGQNIFVHNSYIGRIIQYGWIFGILMSIILYLLFKYIKVIFSSARSNLEGVNYAQIAALSLISVIIQALFHNSSIFTFNSTSLTVMSLFLVWFDLLSIKYKKVLTIVPAKK